MFSRTGKLRLALDFIQNMGWRYVVFRITYFLQIKTGYLKFKFPTNPEFKTFISLIEWRKNAPPFFFKGKTIEGLKRQPGDILKSNFEKIKSGKIRFFSYQWKDLGNDFNWITNPETGFKYNINNHWSDIESLSETAGDIKFVWEKARFSYLYDIIRYDYHFEDDQSEFVFSEIINFIDKNPINQGPNYVCSQEISLRILNWTFALYFYKDSKALTEQHFSTIVNSIYWQLHHVYHNINFSRIAVRNNHAITETMMLYLSNLLFPFIPETKTWSKKGKAWFEEEVAYQIYEDGTFLQFSMNYHRVVVQLLTWGIRLAQLNSETFKPVVFERAQKSLDFLDTCLDPVSGKLPNYGSNDGALFFKLTDDDYRVYKSQLDDLRAVLKKEVIYETTSYHWYGITDVNRVEEKIAETSSFKKSGYYIVQEGTTKSFLKCGAYKDRPAQSDNLHLDIWHNGKNYLWDSGSYKYNTDSKTLNYFMGVTSHNTVSIDYENQMLKGSRFIWNYWIKEADGKLFEEQDRYIFKGYFKGFKYIGEKTHIRVVVKTKQDLAWNITDTFEEANGLPKEQFWNINPDVLKHIEISAKDSNGKIITPVLGDVWYSGYYGQKTLSKRLTFATTTNQIITSIKILN